MCGIVGFTGPPAPELLRRMCRALTHRGPDDEGYLDHPEVSLGMRRLAIVDLAGGRQPVANEDATIHTVFNGEIYNHAALRRDLLALDHRFASHHSDTETIVHAYEQHGNPLNRCLETNQRELLPNQVLPFVDTLSMAHSIKVHCPFLDHRRVEYVNRLPGSFKIDGPDIKRILRGPAGRDVLLGGKPQNATQKGA